MAQVQSRQKMVQDMAHLLSSRNTLLPIRKAVLAAFLILLFSLIASMLFAAPALAEEKDSLLERSGIIYPEGYDINTVGEVSGKVYQLYIPETGPVRFLLLSKKESYTVLLSPRWYWEDLKVKLSDGDEVTVIGSKSLGKDGNLYIIAQELKISVTGKSIVLRNRKGMPEWSGAGQGFGGMNKGKDQFKSGGGMRGGGRGGR